MVVDLIIETLIDAELPELKERIHPQMAIGEVEAPYLVFNKLKDEQEKNLDDTFESIAFAEFDLFLWSESYYEGKELSEKIKDVFNQAPNSIGGITIERITIEESTAERDDASELHLSPLVLRVFYQK